MTFMFNDMRREAFVDMFTYDELNVWIDQHTTLVRKEITAYANDPSFPVVRDDIEMQLRLVTQPMHVFKQTTCIGEQPYQLPVVITNLIILPGAHVILNAKALSPRWTYSSLQMRASAAYVHSSYDLTNMRSVHQALSLHDRQFEYNDGDSVEPRGAFDVSADQSYTEESGIYFYVNLYSALTFLY